VANQNEMQDELMSKKLILIALFGAVSTCSYGQGQVNFVTRTLGTSAQVYNSLGLLANGSLYYAQLYAADGIGQSSESLNAVGNPVNFRTGLNAGWIQEVGTPAGAGTNVPVNTTVNVTTVDGGAVTLQLRAWSSSFPSYAAALANAAAERGASPVLNLVATGNPNGVPVPGVPVDLNGLSGFTMAAPEPSIITLGILGASSLLFWRRRN
jgi:hypothetical protein